ncbi:hypothetical protein [Altericroceibacterium endophyticum]|uniref:Uncharacterized protein n=1 Tax=Altericroceibacterium endophyticum TaxID=1808508 RepID=A0A6I4T5U0_9SPHN|nr:hypothetical protein [Altericroceibacterium endophyticum]MXO65789.1 hypothetical protein [Altericroceibacterium endophyticum]
MPLTPLISAALLPLFLQTAAQGTTPDLPVPSSQTAMSSPATIERDRLTVCLEEARQDPATAIVTASTWLAEVVGPERSYPQQCLGMAYTSLLRWQAAEDSFMMARNARLEDNHLSRAKLAAMAGNAALADNRLEDALGTLDLALRDAALTGDPMVSGGIEVDRARTLVGLGRMDEARQALATARQDAAQNSEAWLLSATLSRREDRLEDAQMQIRTAAGLAPQDPRIGLEAGVIAMLAGDSEAARASWESVIALDSDSEQAATARTYLSQMKETP